MPRLGTRTAASALLCAAALAAGLPARADDRRQAEALLHQGSELFNQGQYERALDRFLAAYQIFKSPLILYNLGQTRLALGRKPEAAQSFAEFLGEAPSNADTALRKREAKDILTELEKTVARLRVRTDPPGGAVLIDGAPAPDEVSYLAAGSHLVVATGGGRTAQTQVLLGLGELREVLLSLGSTLPASQAQLDVRSDPPGAALRVDGTSQGVTPVVTRVAPGQHTLTASRDGFLDLTQSVTATGGATTQLELTLPPEPSTSAASTAPLGDAGAPPSSPLALTEPVAAPDGGAPTETPMWVWSDVGLGVVAAGGLGGGVGFGAAAQRASSQLVGRYHSGAAAQALEQEGRQRESAANVLYVVGAVAASAGVALFIGKEAF